MSKKLVNKKMWVEDLLDKYPKSQNFLSKKGVVCVMCGEPVWGTLEEAMQEKGFSSQKIDTTIGELNSFLRNINREE